MREIVTAGQLSSMLEAHIAQIAPEWLAKKPDLRARLTETFADDPATALIPAMSYEEFLKWAAKHNLHAEWVGGEVIVMSPASIRHQLLVMFLSTLLNLYISRHNLGILLNAPFQMRLHNPPRGREPDIAFVTHASTTRFTAQYLDGPADLVIEIISPESIARDRGEKFYEYEAAGVREYWLIDPQREQAEFYQLDAQGQ